MSEYANTFNDLIAGTLSSLENSDATSIGSYAVYANQGLEGETPPYENFGIESVTLPNVESVGTYGLANNLHLTSAALASVEALGDYAFYNDYSLSAVTAPNLKTIGNYAFQNTLMGRIAYPGVTSVGTYINNGSFNTTVDLTNAASIPANAFNGASSMTELILRSETLIPLNGTSAFTGTGIANSLGYIYVPDELVDVYKGGTNWSTYAARIQSLDDYPLTLPTETITDSWEDIFAAELDGTYSTKYALGDIKCVEIAGAKIPMQIVGFDLDSIEGGGTAKITWLSVYEVLQRYMNVTNVTTGGWADCYLRAFLQKAILPKIDPVVLNEIKSVVKSFRNVGSSTTTEQVYDSLWIPSQKEMFNTQESFGCTYTGYFTSNALRIKKNGLAGSAAGWWTRSAYSAASFYNVRSSGSSNNYYASNSYGVVLGFCT